jgi:hypothetical protein
MRYPTPQGSSFPSPQVRRTLSPCPLLPAGAPQASGTMDPRPFGCEPESRPCDRTTLEATHRYVGLLRIESCPRRNGTTGGPVLFHIPRGKTRVFWRRPARLEVFGPDGAHEHLERWTFAPSGMNRSRPYGRKLSRPPPSPRPAAADGKGPRRAPISVEGMPRCISSTLTGISRRRQILRMCPPKNLTPTSRMGHWEPSLSQIGVQLEAGSEQIEAMISYRSLPRVRSHRCGGECRGSRVWTRW